MPFQSRPCLQFVLIPGGDYTLLGNPVRMKTWVKWMIGLLVGAVVIVAIAVPVALLVNKDNGNGDEDSRRTYTLDDYFGDQLRFRAFSAEWVSDHEYVHRTRENNLLLHNVEGETVTTLLSNNTLNGTLSYYSLSADRKYALLQYNYEKVWRHSYKASYRIYDIERSNYVTTNELPDQVQYVTWSPVGHKLAYVWRENIYVKETPEGMNAQITSDGEENKILNGIPDWVYEEEMFSTSYALWWSPSAKYLSYVQFNDTNVPVIEYTYYGPESDQYPHTVHIPYPKAGTTNPTVKLFTVNTESLTTISPAEILAPTEMRSIDHYIATMAWVTDQRVAIQWLRRFQNVSLLVVCDLTEGTQTWNCPQTVREESTTGWVGNFGPSEPVFASDNRTYYKIISNGDGFKHVHFFDGNQAPVAITSGRFEVTAVVSLTSASIYYISNEGYPSRRHLYKKAVGTGAGAPECITCNLRSERCQRNSAYFSHDAKYFFLTCSGPGIPIYTLRRSSDNHEMKVLEDNEELRIKLEDIQLPTKENTTFSIHGFDLWYQMILPPHFDKTKKYPLLMDVYAGPCSQKTDQFFRLNWATYLASTEQVIVASFDGRGSGYQGDAIMHQLNRRLGTVEVEDQIAAVRHFISLGFIDEKRIAMWGWSYGGYVTSMVLGSGSQLFKCGIAVAPVSSWQYYDTIYTERYMSLPTEADNLRNYLSSTVMSRAEKFKDVEYLLIHGTADDNVHFQQAAQISQALVDAQVDFETMWYTDKDHGISGLANRHIYTHMSHFLKKCFDLP